MVKNSFLINKQHSILLVDDHPIFRYGLAQLIKQEADLSVCGESEDASGALRAIDNLRPDLVIVDIGLKGPSGIELIRDIVVRYKKLPILVLSMHEESLFAERVLRLGAKGYIMKQGTYEQVIKAIRHVLNGKIYISEKMSENIVHKFVDGSSTDLFVSPVQCLTDRELEVFRHLGGGLSTRKISQMLNLSINTINTYKNRIKGKLNVENSSELVQRALHWVQIGSE